MPNSPKNLAAQKVLSDQPAEEDLLWADAYSHALADFLTHEDTQPPLVIGIDAQRGGGKTSLMKALRRRLDPGFDQPPARARRMTVGRLQRFLKGEAAPKSVSIEQGSKPITVWFNAWKYSRDERLWAALVRTVMQQVTAPMDPVEREDFLLRLNLRRVDREKIRRRIRRIFFNQLLPWAALQMVMLLAVIFGLFEAELGKTTMLSLSAVPAFGMVLKWWQAKRKPLSVDLQLDQYVKEPRYDEKVGFQAEVEEDFRRVQEALGPRGRLVIFVDDLDRCTPGKMGELLEAINMFLEFDECRCFFLLGSDRAYLQAGIESAYGALHKALGEAGNEFGQHFLAKIVQVWLRLPTPDDQTMRRYLDAILEGHSGTPQEVHTAQGKEAVRWLVEKKPVLREILAAGGQELAPNPRQVKLFLSRFRLEALIQLHRGEVLGEDRLRELAIEVAQAVRENR